MLYKNILFLLLLTITLIFGQSTHTLSGFVYDESNGESMIGANIYVKELAVGTSSNVYGFYSITLPDGEYTIEVSFVGYEKVSEKIDFNESNRLDFRIKSTFLDLEEVVVQGEKADENVKSTKMGTTDIVPKEIDKVPVLLGEKDILKTIQLLPGISSAGEGNSGFIVRGGSADQNLGNLR